MVTMKATFHNIQAYAKWLDGLGWNVDADNIRRSSALFLKRQDKTMLERTLKTAELIYADAHQRNFIHGRG